MSTLQIISRFISLVAVPAAVELTRNVRQARQVFLPARPIRPNRRVIPVFLPTLPIPSNHQRATPLDGLIHMAMDAIGTRRLTCRAAPSTVVPLKAKWAWRMTIAAIARALA